MKYFMQYLELAWDGNNIFRGGANTQIFLARKHSKFYRKPGMNLTIEKYSSQ